MSQIDQAFPEAEALCIEYPGYIKNFDSALQTLGGTEKIAQALQGPKHRPLPLNFRPEDPLSHPLDGERQDLSGCLLRFSRSAGAGQPDLVKGSIVARLTTSYTFTGIADFQYGSNPSHPEQEIPGAVPEPLSTGPQPLQCLPTRFSFVDTPIDYGFRSFYSKDPAEYKAGALYYQPGHTA